MLANSETQDVPRPQPSPAQAAVVLVDDDTLFLKTFGANLERAGYQVSAYSDPSAVMAALSGEGQRDAYILDWHMPRMDGLELISIARREQPSTVRVLMTGQNALETAIEAINRGEVFRYVHKPFEGAKFRSVITDALTRHRELAVALAERHEALRRERYLESIELTHPGICAIDRDVDGYYIVPEVCNAVASRLLGFDGRTA